MDKNECAFLIEKGQLYNCMTILVIVSMRLQSRYIDTRFQILVFLLNAACLATHTNFIVFSLTRSWLQPTTFCTRGEHANWCWNGYILSYTDIWTRCHVKSSYHWKLTYSRHDIAVILRGVGVKQQPLSHTITQYVLLYN
jgi:hypothetical protein